jgi:hypothetical protein
MFTHLSVCASVPPNIRSPIEHSTQMYRQGALLKSIRTLCDKYFHLTMMWIFCFIPALMANKLECLSLIYKCSFSSLLINGSNKLERLSIAIISSVLLYNILQSILAPLVIYLEQELLWICPLICNYHIKTLKTKTL